MLTPGSGSSLLTSKRWRAPDCEPTNAKQDEEEEEDLEKNADEEEESEKEAESNDGSVKRPG